MNHQKVYESIIQKAKYEDRIKLSKSNINYIYYEKHHIMPRCLGGTNDAENLVLLTAKEHFVCHKLLTYIYKGNRKIALAFHKMSFSKKEEYNATSRDYAYARILISYLPLSQETKNKISTATKHRYKTSGCSEETRKKLSIASKGRIPPNKGKPMSNEQKIKLSLSHKEKPRIISEETRKKMSESAKKKPPILEKTRKKMSESRKGEKNPMFGKSAMRGKHHSKETKEKMRKPKLIVTCPYCNKSGGISIMHRFHFNRCKEKRE